MNDKVVLITGSGSGMGKATALLAAEKGAKVVVADMEETSAQKVVDKIKEKSGEAIAIACDVRKDAEVKAMIDQTVKIYGRLDAAFNNAGSMMRVNAN